MSQDQHQRPEASLGESSSPGPGPGPRLLVLTGAALAVMAVSVAGWIAVRRSQHQHMHVQRLEERAQNIMADMGITPDQIRPIAEEAFVGFSDGDGVSKLMPALTDRFFALSAQTPGLGDLPTETRRGFAEAATLSLEPFLADDFDMHMRHVQQLGGSLPNESPDPQEAWRQVRFRWGFNSNRFTFTALATDRAEVVLHRTPDQPADKFSGNKLGYRLGWLLPGGHISKTTERYPDLKGWDEDGAGLAVYEARVPVMFFLKKLGQTRQGVLGVGLARSPETEQWQPAVIRFYHDDTQNPDWRSREEIEAYLENLPGNLWM